LSLGRLPVVGYGKVPCGPEFFRLETVPGLSSFLRRWLDEGHESLAIKKWGEVEGGKRGEVETAAHYWVLATPEAKAFLVGEIRPSRGRGGRRFPLSVAVVVPIRPFLKRFHLIPFAFQEVWRQISKTLDKMIMATEENEVREVFSRLSVGLAQSPRKLNKKVLEAISQEKLSSLGGDANSPGDGPVLQRILGNMGESLRPFFQSGRSDLGLGLRIPLVTSFEGGCLQASFWLQFIARSVNTRKLICSFFLPNTKPDNGVPAVRDLLLFFRNVGPREYCWLMGGMGENAIHDLTANGAPEPPLSGKEVLKEPTAHLSDLLNSQWSL